MYIGVFLLQTYYFEIKLLIMFGLNPFLEFNDLFIFKANVKIIVQYLKMCYFLD